MSRLPASSPSVRLTVGLPVRNGERYIAEALGSLSAQTDGDFVVLVGDNQSTDRTSEIVQDLAVADPRIRYILQPANLGGAVNFSRLVHLAETELFRWHASDDLVHPEYQAKCIAALDSEPGAVLAYGKTIFIDALGAETGPYEDKLHLVQDSARARFTQVYRHLSKCNVQYGVTRRAVMLRTQLMKPYVAADMAYLYELALHGKFVEVAEPLFFRRLHDENLIALPESKMRMFWEPDRWERPSFRTWHLIASLERAILKAPLGGRERVLLQADLVREACSKLRRRLIGEAAEGVSYAHRHTFRTFNA